MIQKKLKLLGTLMVGLSIVLIPFSVQAANLPDIPGADSPGEDAPFPELITYIFAFLLWVGTILVAASLIYGGILYLTSRGNPAYMQKAKTRITYSALGLLILLSSFLLLNTISPQFVNLVWEKPATSTVSFPSPTPSPSKEATTTFQELPIGTLTEKLLAKDIDCYKKGEKYETMVDCQDRSEVDTLVNQKEARRGYCYDLYDLSEGGEFKDANPDTEQVDPITEHDRMDCLLKFQDPVNQRMKKLKDWSEDLKKEILKQCKCSNCKKEGCECVSNSCPSLCNCTKLECIGKPYNNPAKDPCTNRKPIDEIREKIRRNHTDKELKKMTVDYFNKHSVKDPDNYNKGEKPVLVADQVRFLMVNFLKPLEKDLRKDLNYLIEAENYLKNECAYQKLTSHAAHYNWKDAQPSLKWKEEKFQEVDITQYCKEFNCKDCKDKKGEKLPCYECNLDEMEKGNCATTDLGEREVKTCKCSEFILNNQSGSSTCTTTDATCTMCKIEATSTNEVCEKYTDDPATFYCPSSHGEDVPQNFTAIVKESSINSEPNSRFPQGLIPIGHTVDDTERFAREILNKLNSINDQIKVATKALFNPEEPGKLKEPAGDPNVLYSHPLGCMCKADPGYYKFPGNCVPVCICIPRQCPLICGPPPLPPCQIKCGSCNKQCTTNPCPMGKINEKISIVKNAEETIKKSFERIRDLVEVKNLKNDDPNRHDLMSMLTNSRKKMNDCVTGFQHVEKGKMPLRSVAACDKIWDLVNTETITIAPKWPLENYEGCYPPDLPISGYQGFENCYPYNSKLLTSNERKTCLENRTKSDCQDAVKNISGNGPMNNYFCVSKNLGE